MKSKLSTLYDWCILPIFVLGALFIRLWWKLSTEKQKQRIAPELFAIGMGLVQEVMAEAQANQQTKRRSKNDLVH